MAGILGLQAAASMPAKPRFRAALPQFTEAVEKPVDKVTDRAFWLRTSYAGTPLLKKEANFLSN
jgi:hypothetical protein